MELAKDKIGHPTHGESATIPSDLLSEAMSETAGWAQEEHLAKLHELFIMTGSWDAVRTIIRPKA